MTKTLHLPLKRQWYKMIESGERREEYREITPYWTRRFYGKACKEKVDDMCEILRNPASAGRLVFNHCGNRVFNTVKFQFGFTKTSMSYRISYIFIGKGRAEWGAKQGKEYFVIGIGRKVEDFKNKKSNAKKGRF